MRPDDFQWIDKETGIWTLEVETIKKRHRFDHILVGAIGSMYRNNIPKEAADLGCGPGWYCRALTGFGWPVVWGYEGTPKIKSLGVYPDIIEMDLSKTQKNYIIYDVVICLEVGEHIRVKHEQTFIDNVVKFTGKDLILSWAIPGQNGTGHFNLRDNEYVEEQFEKRGLEYDPTKSEWLREKCFYDWFKNTLMVFRRVE